MSFVAVVTPHARVGAWLAMREAALSQGWRVTDVTPSVWVATQRQTVTHEAFAGGQMVVIGDIASDDPSPWRDSANGRAACESAVRRSWGRYVLLALDEAGRLAAVCRDPSGALDCAVRQVGSDWVVAGAVPDWLAGAITDRAGLSWTAIGEALADPIRLSTANLLDGWRTLAPGHAFQPYGPDQVLWSPAQAARSGGEVDPQGLRDVVDLAVKGLVRGRDRLVVEVSGGLDSAIMAASLQAAGSAGFRLWLNTHGPFREADERAYAEAVAKRLGVSLTTVERRRSEVASGLDLSHPRTLRPGLNRLDAAYDRLQADLCAAHGVQGVLTGKGGDVAFFQTATSAILADQFRDQGFGVLTAATAPVLARRLRRSAWRTLRAGLVGACSPRSYRPARNPLLSPDLVLGPGDGHPWLSDLEGLGPGKQQQIVGFASNLGLHSPSRRTAQADLLHPALSQPVMEAVLATPTWRLTRGGHDRLLAREAFADRLPPELVRRRSKAELGAYYGRVVAANIARLRPHLLEGRLARQGLIDHSQVEAALSVDHLIWQGGYIELMLLALMESWVQAWEH